jgi:DNA helicase-4
VAYLLHRALREPQEILALAFSRDAKSELETRIEKRVGRPIQASTFHALGLAIIGQCEGRRPDVSVLSTDPAKMRRFIMEHLEKMLDTPQLRARLVTWFLEYLVPYRSPLEFQTEQGYYDYLQSQPLRSLKGDLVKSREERTIADFLFTNGIDYQYEAPYEHDTATSERRQYKPDFKIGDRGLYIEHFAINDEGRTPPFIAEVEYKASMAWKRELHQKYNTQLIETYSWQHSDGSLLPSLEKSLREAGVVFKPLSAEESREHLRKLGDVDRFSDLLGTFLRHARSNQREIAEMRNRADSRPDVARMRAFLDVFEPILKAYVDELTEAQEIDFEGMIVRAAGYAENARYVSPYRAIIVDEFQDISIARARLIKGLLRQHPLNRLFAVGDDWQSIYRFAGSDISIMRNFGEWFGYSTQVALDRTFRFNQLLSDCAADFVCRNSFQLPKKVTSDKVQDGAPITIIARGKNADDPLSVALESIAKRKSQQRVSVQLLGRYNFNKPRDLPGLNRDFPGLNIEFRTVHGSKGLEADFVIVLDLLGGRYGFPSEIADDPVLSLVLAEAETYPNAEERRLFYVALTRARVGVYLLTDNPQSSFLNELRGQPGVYEMPTPR